MIDRVEKIIASIEGHLGIMRDGGVEYLPFKPLVVPAARGKGSAATAGDLKVVIVWEDTKKSDDMARLERIISAMNAGSGGVKIIGPIGAAGVLRALKPEVVIFMGDKAYSKISPEGKVVSDARGIFTEFSGFKTMVTFGPDDINKDTALRTPVWEDIQKVMEAIGVK